MVKKPCQGQFRATNDNALRKSSFTQGMAREQEGKRARGQESKRARENVKMRRCEDVRM